MPGDGRASPARASGKIVVGSFLATAARRFRDRQAYFCAGTGRRFTFRQTNERCNQLAHGLRGLGLRKPEVVAFLCNNRACNNRAELAEIYFALAKSGLVGIPFSYRLAPPECVELMQAMGVRALLFATRFAAAAAQVRAALPEVGCFVAIGEDRPDWALGYEDLLAGGSPAEPEAEVEEDDPFCFNLTSGTTGLPKSYVLTHYNNSTLGPSGEAFGTTSNDVIMTAFPAFGRVGFFWIAIGVAFGARNVLLDFSSSEALRLIETERVTMVNLVPKMAAMMLVDPSLTRRDLRSLRALVFAGAMFPAPLRERVAAEISSAVYEYYGMQETGLLTLSTPEDRVRQAKSVGVAVCFAEVKIARADGSRASCGELGEILGRSPNAVASYFDNPGKSVETFRDGWVHTGDLGYQDEEGYLFIRGRLKDMIITGGQNVHAAEVEEAILRVEGVAECAVFALPDELWGERMSAVVVTEFAGVGTALSAETIEEACREHLAGFKIPRAIFVQEEPLPRTPTGKVQKFLLVERHSSGDG